MKGYAMLIYHSTETVISHISLLMIFAAIVRQQHFHFQKSVRKMERAKGFEPSTFTLANIILILIQLLICDYCLLSRNNLIRCSIRFFILRVITKITHQYGNSAATKILKEG